MKIVILSDGIPPVGLGGAEVVAYNLAQALSKKGNEVSIITTVRKKDEAGVFKDGDMTVYKIYSDYHTRWRAYRSLNNIKVVKQFKNIIRDIRPDIVHAHNVHEHLSYASLKISKKYSKVVFLTFHDLTSLHYSKLGAYIDFYGNIIPDKISPFKHLLDNKFRYNPFRNIIIKHYLKYVDRLFSVSGVIKIILEKNSISPVEVVHNGIDISNWAVDEDALIDFKKKYNLENKKVLFFGGRLSSAKGGSVVIDVLENISKKVNNVVLLVAGNKNKSAEEMLERAEKLGVKDRIVFTGWIEHKDIRYAYASSDVVLVLSQYIDPFPTVNLEAMASKRPVVGTMFGGTPEAVLDGKTGYIVNPRDVGMISEKILNLLENPEKARQFGLAGHERVSSEFSEDVWVEKTISHYGTMFQNNK
ncbi:MAG: glycosyltransferase family 4 protein [Nitrospira sp.]